MTRYVISPVNNKQVEEITTWVKDGEHVIRTEWFRWGSWCVNENAPPSVDLANPNGYAVYDVDVNWELLEMVDGVWEEWQYPNGWDPTACDDFQDNFAQDGYWGLENLGWEVLDTQVILHGELVLSQLED